MRKWLKVSLLFLTCIMAVCVAGCDDKKKSNLQLNTEEATKDLISYNASDIAVVISKDAEEGRISLKSGTTGSVYSVNYNGGTKVYSKFGNDILMEQVDIGSVVKANYIEGTRKLVELWVSDEAWENTMAVNIDVDYDKQILTIGSSSYAYDENLFIYSDGMELDIRELSGIDELTVRGYGTKALSIVVDKGHGFIRLKDEDNYVGGIIEVGSKIMTRLTEDMIIAAPEGEYKVTVSKNGLGGEQSVTVKRGMETLLSLGSFEQPVERVGSVNFIIGPDDADALLYIDGVKTDYDELVRVSFGDHVLVIKSNNYDTITKKITIASTYTTININMSGEEESSEESTEKDDNDSKDDGDEKINVNAPEGAMVYFDGVYKGIAPISFDKEEGEHVIILSKDGYETKMYTIDVVADGEDMDITLPDMLKKN